MNRSKTAFLAAMMGSLFFAVASNAFATVRCVNTTHAGCTAATTYPKIGLAVAASGPGDTIFVGAGQYNENVVIPSADSGLSLLGAQAGNDARKGRGDPKHESTVNANFSGTTGTAIMVNAMAVTIDGFTVTGGFTIGNASGISIESKADGAKVSNNILTGNGTGLSLDSEGFSPPVNNVQVYFNLFKVNNLGCPSATTCSGGDGIFSGGVQDSLISDNAFVQNLTSAIGINSGSSPGSKNVVISNNSSDQDAGFVVFTGTSSSTVDNNEVEDSGKAGAFFPGSGSAAPTEAISIGPGNSNLTIIDNELEGEDNSPITRGIAATGIFGPGLSSNLVLGGNEVHHYSSAAIAADPNTLVNSNILANEADDGAFGIFIDAGNKGNMLAQNEAHGKTFACKDNSVGLGTSHTANRWFDNKGDSSSPSGLCNH